MQIDAIELYHLALPRKTPSETPAGTFDTLEVVLARLESDGVSGWGEVAPGNAPLVGHEWAGGTFACAEKWLAGPLVGRRVESADSLESQWAKIRGNQHAKAVLDMAWWDLKARLDEKPLHELLGGKETAVAVGVGFDQMEKVEDLLNAIEKAFADGYSRVELKFRPGWDIEMLNVVRSQFPVETLHVDVEGDMTLDHMEILCRLDDFCVDMVEQPLAADDLVGHAMVQETIRTPVCLDESITTLDQARMALDLKSGQFLNVKIGRVGGLTTAMAIHDAAHDECTPCWVGSDPQSALGMRHSLALATKSNFTYPADFVDSANLLEQDLVEPLSLSDVGDEDGRKKIAMWTEPGIGVEPNAECLEKFCVNRVRLA